MRKTAIVTLLALACILLGSLVNPAVNAADNPAKTAAAENPNLPLAEVHERQIIVRFNLERMTKSASAYVADSGLKHVSTMPLSYADYEIVQVPEGMDYHSMLAQLQADPAVQSAGPNVIKRTSATLLNDPLLLNSAEDAEQGLTDPWAKNNQWGLLQTRAHEAWDLSTGSRDVVVAVLDTGSTLAHEDLASRIWINEDEIPDNETDDDKNGFIDDVYGWNFEGWNNSDQSGGSNDVNDPTTSDASHGTATSSIIGAEGGNGLGIAGVAGGDSASNGVRLMILRVGTNANITVDAEIGAIDYAIANGADIISMSFGGYSGGAVEEDAIDRAWNAGIFVLAAAGNVGQGNQTQAGEPLIDLPAGFANCVCVGATTIFDTQRVTGATQVVAETLAGYSKTGAEMEISAPGTHIMGAASGTDVYTDEVARQFTGTSAATPVVAGLAALLLSYEPALTNNEIRSRINNYAVDLGTAGRDEDFGWGRIDMHASLTEDEVIIPVKAGDTNGDEVVDENDLQPIIDSFGAQVGDADYQERIDTNEDGVIDELDLFEVGRRFGS